MSGPKAYTMKEMKGIVEYIVEHKAFSEYKGRKMWMDFASSSLTSRTWQSLKETFLKRILPDIQNPYYKLTRDQVCSFKQGVDVEKKERNNRLEIRTISEESSNNDNQEKIEPVQSSSTKKQNKVDKNSGEDIKSEKILSRNRSSADTYIIEETSEKFGDEPAHIKTTEELRTVLEEGEPLVKPLKYMLEYEQSEPMTAVKRVLKDFETESEDSDKEPQMQIVEDTPRDENQEVILVEDSDNVNNSINIDNEGVLDAEMEVEIGPVFIEEVTNNLQSIDIWLEECEEDQKDQVNNEAECNLQETYDISKDVSHESEHVTVEESEPVVLEVSEPVVIEDSEIITADDSKEISNKKSLNGDKDQNSLSTTSDTMIPNNQEALINTDIIKNLKTDRAQGLALSKKASRKRSASQDVNVTKKHKVNGEDIKTNGDLIKTPPSSNNTEALFEAVKNSTVDNETCQNAQDITPEIKNPCLTSVSLFEEGFNTTTYIDSEEETTIPDEQKPPSADKNQEHSIDLRKPETSIKQNKQEASANEKIENKSKLESSTVERMLELNAENEQKQHLSSEPENKTVNYTNVKEQKVTNKHTNENKPTEDDQEEIALQAVTQNKSKEPKEVIVLKSNSESESELSPVNPKENINRLGHAFGFVPGTSVTATYRRRPVRRARTALHRNSCTVHNSSEWEDNISEPECSRFISPPRGRRDRHAREYRKPQSERIMSLAEDGGLFILHDNKAIPLIKNGKVVTFVTLDGTVSDDLEGETDSVWRQKYEDEKKKSAELQRKLAQAEAEASPRENPSNQRTNAPRNTPTASSTTVQLPMEIETNHQQMHIKKDGDAGKIQITLSKNEETVNLEGQWPQVLPIMEHVMNIFYKAGAPSQPETKTQAKGDSPVHKPQVTEPTQEDISGLTTPIIHVVDLGSRQVEDLENEIFKQIEILDKEEKTTSKVTTRRAARTKRNPSTSSEQSEPAPKKKRTSKKASTVTAKDSKKAKPDNKSPQITETALETGVALAESKTGVALAESNTELGASAEHSKEKEPAKESPKKNTTAAKDKRNNKLPLFEPPVTRSRKSGNESDTSTLPNRRSTKIEPDPDDDGVRYMLPPPARQSRRNSKNTPNKAGSPKPPQEMSQEHRSRDSVHSQAYLDSDSSAANTQTRKKTKLSFPVRKYKQAKRIKALPTVVIHDISLDSSLSKYFVPKKSEYVSTSDSAAYKTDSFKIRRHSVSKLDAIEEKTDENLRHFRAVSKESSVGASSSSVSLPFSPELSIVDNISITRDAIQTDRHPNLNASHPNSLVNELYNQYLFSSFDVSVPMMQQDCKLLNTGKTPKTSKRKSPINKSPMKVSHFLDKVCAVNMAENNTLSESLDIRLRDLLLESAKKISRINSNEMEVDSSMETGEPVLIAPKRNRCSTPQKKSAKTRAKKKIDVCPAIEEHTESCLRGRISCPPILSWKPNADDTADIKLTRKAKKDIIKVKIQRPSKTRTAPEVENTSQVSMYTDSGINHSDHSAEDSVELIHNHSETCLQANECMESGFLQGSDTVVSVDSSQSSGLDLMKAMEEIHGVDGTRSDHQDVSGEKSSEEVYGTPTDNFESPVISNSSIITEDLSYPPSPTKWYLLSDDETKAVDEHVTTRPEPTASISQMTGFSNLKQLFPITCAVPDLSTISELSKESDSKGFDDASSKSSDCF